MVVREDEAVGSGQVGGVIVGRLEREGGRCYNMTLSSYVLGNPDGEEREIDNLKKTHWHQRLPTLTTRKPAADCIPVISSSEFLRLRNLGILLVKVF